MHTDALGVLGSVLRLDVAISVVVACLILPRIRQFYRLKQFKGPATAGISWWWHSKAVLSGQAQRYYGDVTEKYGECERTV
jgi:hypothetical protein